MTALVTGIGLVPLALGAGEPSKEIQQPMAIGILGGIVTSTVLKTGHPRLYLHFTRETVPAAHRWCRTRAAASCELNDTAHS